MDSENKCKCVSFENMSNIKESVKADFLLKYPYLFDELDDIYERAKNTYLDIAFPFRYDITDIPSNRPRAIYWIKDCMQEIIDRNGITATSYAENGISLTWSTDMLSDVLRTRIVPMAVVRGARK